MPVSMSGVRFAARFAMLVLLSTAGAAVQSRNKSAACGIVGASKSLPGNIRRRYLVPPPRGKAGAYCRDLISV